MHADVLWGRPEGVRVDEAGEWLRAVRRNVDVRFGLAAAAGDLALVAPS